jgi:hypothetical protein
LEKGALKILEAFKESVGTFSLRDFTKNTTRMVIFSARVKLERVNITDSYHARAELLVSCENYQFSGLKNVTQRF